VELVASGIRNEQSSRVGRGINGAITMPLSRLPELLPWNWKRSLIAKAA
jgi:hypothetical protein